jgi:alpha-galactosidase
LRPYFYGDYYPLTESRNNQDENNWLAYQLNRPSKGDGIIIAFRRKDCKQETIQVKPGGLDKTANYEINIHDYNLKMNLKGSELMAGFDLTIPQKPSSVMVSYHRIENR